MGTYDRASEAALYISDRFKKTQENKPSAAIVIGSGGDGIMDCFEIIDRIQFSHIPHMLPATFHNGAFHYCTTQEGNPVIICQGRLHYYEGYTAREITFPIRILQQLGISHLYMTNAAGGLNADYGAGEVILINDHINLLPDHPLRGANDDRLGLRFPDMSEAYSKSLRKSAKKQWQNEHGSQLREGVYVCFQGPSLETPAEYNYLNNIGADLVGMSTVPEVIVANHAGMEVCVLSIVTNICYPPEKITPTTLEEVIEMAKASSKQIGPVLYRMIAG